MKTQTLDTTDAATFPLNTRTLRERIAWLREQDAQTPYGALLVLSILERSQPTEGLYSLTPAELSAYFASGYEILQLSSTPSSLGTEHRFLLRKHATLDSACIAQALFALRNL